MTRLIVRKVIWHLDLLVVVGNRLGGCRKLIGWLSETDRMVVGNRSDGCRKSNLMLIGCPSGGYRIRVFSEIGVRLL